MYSTAINGMCANLNHADVTAKGATVMTHLSGNALTHKIEAAVAECEGQVA